MSPSQILAMYDFESVSELIEYLKFDAEPHEEKILKKALSDIDGFSE